MKPWRLYDRQLVGSNRGHRFSSNPVTVVGSDPVTGSNPGHVVGSNPIEGDKPRLPRKPAKLLTGHRSKYKYARRKKTYK